MSICVNNTILPLYGTMTGSTYPGQRGAESKGNEEGLQIRQSPQIGSSQSDGL